MQKMKQLCLASAACLLALPLAAQQTVRVPLYDSYGPVLVAPGASLRVCANNLFGTSTFQARIYFFDALNARAVLSSKLITLNTWAGDCASYAVPPTDQFGAANPRLLLAGFAPVPGANTSLMSLLFQPAHSAQVISADSRTATFVPAVQYTSVELPAVQ